MFAHNLTTVKHFTSKHDGQDAYEDFLLKIGLSNTEYPFEVKRGGGQGKKTIVLKASSWGSYINADNEWRIFIAHLDTKTRFTRFISWSWDKDQQALVDMQCNTWVP